MLVAAEPLAGAPTAAAARAESLPTAQERASLPDSAVSAPTEAQSLRAAPSGQHFIAWLRQGIRSRKLIINDAKALVHTVAGTAYLVSPGIFQRYAQEHPQAQALAKTEDLPDWRWVQRRFEKLQLHRKQPDGLNIWTCEVSGPRKTLRLHGYLLDDPAIVFDAVPADNPYLAQKPSQLAGK